jgi:hypothetical protein
MPHAPLITSDVEAREQIEFLTSELDERDQLIAALTSQLEGAVEQLDRLHRQGTDRNGRSSSGGGVPFEFIEDQRAVADRVSQWLDQWDQLQPMELWLRMESRINELASHLGSPSSPEVVYQEPVFAPPAAIQEQSNSSDLSAWEETKQRLLGGLGDPAALLGGATQTQAEAAANSASEIPAPAADLEFPQAIDVDSAEREELVQAIDVRDRYISDLTHRLRAAEMRQPVDWDALSQAPADLRQQLEDLESRYREHLRREECDLALERARLAREQARLQQDRHRFDQQMRRAGLSAGEPQNNSAADDERSWLKMFLGDVVLVRHHDDRPAFLVQLFQ